MYEATLNNYKGLVQAINVTNQCQDFFRHELIRDLSHMPHTDFQDLCHSIATNMTAVAAYCYDAVVVHQDMMWHYQQTQLVTEEAITPPQALERERCIQDSHHSEKDSGTPSHPGRVCNDFAAHVQSADPG